MAATKTRKNLRHAAGGGWCRAAGEVFFSRELAGGKRVTAGAMGGATSNGRRWAGGGVGATKTRKNLRHAAGGGWCRAAGEVFFRASCRVEAGSGRGGGRGGVAATKKQGPDCSKPLEKEKYYEIRSIPSAPYRGGRFRSISKALQGSARHRRR